MSMNEYSDESREGQIAKIFDYLEYLEKNVEPALLTTEQKHLFTLANLVISSKIVIKEDDGDNKDPLKFILMTLIKTMLSSVFKNVPNDLVGEEGRIAREKADSEDGLFGDLLGGSD